MDITQYRQLVAELESDYGKELGNLFLDTQILLFRIRERLYSGNPEGARDLRGELPLKRLRAASESQDEAVRKMAKSLLEQIDKAK